MTGVELIVAALVAGASAGATSGATTAVDTLIGDLYRGLKSLVTRKLGDRTAAVAAVEADQAEPGTLRPVIEPALVESGADTDRLILEKAQELLAQSEAAAGKYVIHNTDIKGQVIGDHSTQTNHFH